MRKLFNKYIPLAYGVYFNLFVLFDKRKAAHKAFTLFCSPRKGRVTAAQASFLKQAENGSEQVCDHQIQTYRWPGEKETVLLLHGWESNTYRWKNLIRFLQKEGYNIIAFDAPAHGKSSGSLFNVPLYIDCISHIAGLYRPNYMIAHSVGGMAALYYQYKFPKNTLQKIVAISPSDLHELMKQYKEVLKYNKNVDNALDAYFVNRFGFGINDFSTALFAREITIPGLLIHDLYDQISPVGPSEKVHSNWKNSKFIRTEGLGHSLHQDQVSEQIIDFLRS
jgi:pimeloyl-ACP methyl ester carboxylesterase